MYHKTFLLHYLYMIVFYITDKMEGKSTCYFKRSSQYVTVSDRTLQRVNLVFNILYYYSKLEID